MIQFILLTFVFVFNISAQAAVQTDTFTYIQQNNPIIKHLPDKLLVINRKTNEEQIIELGESAYEMKINNGFGYIVSSEDRIISIIDLSKGKLIKQIKIKGHPGPMLIHNGFGYIISKDGGYPNEHTGLSDPMFIVINLTKNTIEMEHSQLTGSNKFVVHGDLGYLLKRETNNVSVMDLKFHRFIKEIPVGSTPITMSFHGDLGYVMNSGSNDVSVIDLKKNVVTNTIPVQNMPNHMHIHDGFGYVMNYSSSSVSVIDLNENKVTETILVGEHPESMLTYGKLAYVISTYPKSISVVDLDTHKLIQTLKLEAVEDDYDGKSKFLYAINREGLIKIDLETGTFTTELNVSSYSSILVHDNTAYLRSYGRLHIFNLSSQSLIQMYENKNNQAIDFSDTYVYLGIKKLRPLYPTLATLARMKAENSLGDFLEINPKAFDVGEVKPRDYPVEENEFDQLPPYVLSQDIFWDLATDKPIIDPVAILATLITMKYPQRFLQTEAGRWLRPRLHMAFFQAVWLGQNTTAQKMLRCFIQLDDPVITKLATYKLVQSSSTSSVANSTSK